MMIDAMDLLYGNRLDGFCIVSSDSDFTALAIRLKEQGMPVYGFGKKQTPKSFVNACTQFIYVENLLPDELIENIGENLSARLDAPLQTAQAAADQQTAYLPRDTIRKIFEQFDSDWVAISALGSTWRRLHADFDPRSYGCKNFTALVKKHPEIFEYKMRAENENAQEHMYVKLKD